MSCGPPITARLAPISRRGQEGFSLVEVTIAVGIVAFAVLPMMGVMALGLSNLGEARDQLTEAHIVSTLTSKIRNLTFEEIGTVLAGETELLFSIEGEEIGPSRADEAAYRETLKASDPVYAGQPGKAGRTMKAVRIEIARLRRANLPPTSYAVHTAKSE